MESIGQLSKLGSTNSGQSRLSILKQTCANV